MRVLAVIPAYNEEACIEGTVTNLVATCPEIDYVIINDGSKDRTKAICEERGFNCVSLPVNTGLTSGFKTGMKYAARHGYDAVVQFDADGQHLPQYIPDMARAMQEQGANIVIASRILAGEAPTGARNLGSKLISWLIKMTTGTVITDPTSGMRMYDRSLIETFAKSFDLAPEPDTVAMLARKGAKVVEVPARMQDRQGGTSYLNFTSSIRYMLRTCFSILMFQWFR